MTDGDISHLVLYHSPRFEVLDPVVIDHANRRFFEEFFQAGKTGGDTIMAVWMITVIPLVPIEKLLRRFTELANDETLDRLMTLSEPLSVCRFPVPRCALVSFGGGLAGAAAVLLAVELEPVMEPSRANPYRHD